MRSYFKRGLLGLLPLVVAPMLHAQASGENDQWQFEVTPYLFAAGLDGTVGVKGNDVDIDASFDDLRENLDSAFMATFIAQKGKWIIAFDGIYTKLKVDETGPAGGKTTIKMPEQIYQLSGAYRILDTSSYSLDLLGGVRYTRLDTDLDHTPAAGDPNPPISLSVYKDWTNAVVGARVLAPFAGNWSFMGYADVGAGDSDLTYLLMAGVNWHFTKALTAKFGYRHLYDDYEDTNVFKWDMTMYGPYLGLGIAF